ncbi:HD domain-containing protein [Candidatus Pacearchaeota archaeon]|nr:HD domain-containing protein [Candidatus Pacearchaeota archaeon]
MHVIDFTGFNGREEKLRTIIRYNIPQRTPMHYRTNDLLHTNRVAVLVEDITPILTQEYGLEFNAEKAFTLAHVHDDAEIITGDVPLYYKDRMTQQQLDEVARNEENAIHELSALWPSTINGFSYTGLLQNALCKDVLEAHVVSYCDKLDALCECLHEVHAGNKRFLGNLRSYLEKLSRFPEKFPSLRKIVDRSHPFLLPLAPADVEKIVENGCFHTEESVRSPTGIPHYDRWRELTIEHFGISPLVCVLEK